jgi:plasmid stabilization system protein ParE
VKVILTESAVRDLDEILAFIKTHYPTLVEPFERRFHAVTTRLSRWPESAPAVAQRPGTRVASLIRYPYRVFYRVTDTAIEIVHIRHAARRPWDPGF